MQEIFRTKFSKHFDTGQVDGQGRKVFQAHITMYPQHYQHPTLGWLDNVLEWEDELGFGNKVKQANHNLRIWNKTLRVGFMSGVFVDYTLPNKTPGFSGRECLIPDAWANSDLKYTVTPEGVKGDIILKAPGHPSAFQFPVKATGCTPQLEGDWLYYYRNGEKVGRAHPPYTVDALGNRGEVALALDGDTIALVPDPIWLAGAVYPIVIDPTTTLQPDATAGKDTHVRADSPSYNFGNASELETMGDPSYIRRSLIEFTSGLPATGSTIALSDLTLNDIQAAGTAIVDIHRTTQSWLEMGATWINQPAHNAGVEASLTVTAGGFYTFNITSLTAGWVAGTYPNYGLLIKHNNENNPGVRHIFASSDYWDTAARPKLVITYSLGGGVPPFGTINTLGRRLIA